MAQRDDIREARNVINERLDALGINMDAERSKPGTTPRTLTYDGIKLINDGTPRVTREQLRVDDPPAGAMNGSNTQFDLSMAVVGQNISVVWHDQVLNQKWVLVKGNANPPLNHEFFYDNSTPTTIVVGNPPNSGDGLVAVYMVQG